MDQGAPPLPFDYMLHLFLCELSLPPGKLTPKALVVSSEKELLRELSSILKEFVDLKKKTIKNESTPLLFKRIIFTPSSELTSETLWILFACEKFKLPWNQGCFQNIQKLFFWKSGLKFKSCLEIKDAFQNVPESPFSNYWSRTREDRGEKGDFLYKVSMITLSGNSRNFDCPKKFQLMKPLCHSNSKGNSL